MAVWATRLIMAAALIAVAWLGLSRLVNMAIAHGRLDQQIIDERRIAEAEARAKQAEADWNVAALEAALKEMERRRAANPIILKSQEVVRTYAQTPDGNRRCLDAGRVRGIAESRAALFPASDTGSTGASDAALPAAAADQPSGR